MRGTPTAQRSANGHRGIIPACAGNTAHPWPHSPDTGDHPRVCGEHMPPSCSILTQLGSSPRVRGTRVHELVGAVRHGIIPACAGNTGIRPSNRDLLLDHPRVCGEHDRFKRQYPHYEGSSPRVRGTRNCRSWCMWSLGIIPACAGNTETSGGLLTADGDHPRVCGEHPISVIPRDITEGSSPRVRGTLHWPHRYFHGTGIIPACAGNTCMSSRRRHPKRDHPRVCGEHTKKIA